MRDVNDEMPHSRNPALVAAVKEAQEDYRRLYSDTPRSEMPTLPDREHDTIATLREHLASARAMVEELRGKLERAHRRADAWKLRMRIAKGSLRSLRTHLLAEQTENARLERALSEKEAEND